MLNSFRSNIGTNIKIISVPTMLICFLLILLLLPCNANADTPLRVISGTITYENGIAPEGGIWITMYAMGENGGVFSTEVLIREGDYATEYAIPIDFSYTNNSNRFIIKCEPQKASNYSAEIYGSLVDVSYEDATNIDFTTRWLTERTISGTITYKDGLAPAGGIKIKVSAIGEYDFETEVIMPEGCSKVAYKIPLDLYFLSSNTSFMIKCSPEDPTNYEGTEYGKLIDIYENNLSNINLTIAANI
ncbi:hypothetical protein EHE19_004355 [Ruminiclostridium herbifermentans]|uniref:Uncharacterized protein n=1 Tax=Ruminiclostridium herbifermentans TaxID=2488810 RepID=A0A4U7JG04_9FIRM|nr:hypothetical protein [Ruminiclostridium herbifermentans]QNU67706.1 hypothetical protein EHE19_004355 [Ruminiclostridium herbifermentans]